MCWGITPTEPPIRMVDYVYETGIYLWHGKPFMDRDYIYAMENLVGCYGCMLWYGLHGQWTRMARARVRLPSDGYAGAPGPFGLGANYVWYLWCTIFGRITTVQCCDKL
ncbi:hypothetical protein M6B38_183920 [Iris pallida]|uniref:Uncharacterized protein n=1 Tax=Iris pallida TaxID=29817 RepID=A0AAX6EKM0_IRIPA|nr:hypothetical protein M6B38_183920 [Iris pallida]